MPLTDCATCGHLFTKHASNLATGESFVGHCLDLTCSCSRFKEQAAYKRAVNRSRS